MKTDVKRKVGSQEQQQNLKNTRSTLKDLQHVACDKENLVGRPSVLKDAEFQRSKKEIKKIKLMNKSVQTCESSAVTVEDLTGEQTSENYWRLLAEKRGEDLDNSLVELEQLKEELEQVTGQVAVLQEENKVCKEMLQESDCLVEVLKEMLAEDESSTAEVTEETTETSTR